MGYYGEWLIQQRDKYTDRLIENNRYDHLSIEIMLCVPSTLELWHWYNFVSFLCFLWRFGSICLYPTPLSSIKESLSVTLILLFSLSLSQPSYLHIHFNHISCLSASSSLHPSLLSPSLLSCVSVFPPRWLRPPQTLPHVYLPFKTQLYFTLCCLYCHFFLSATCPHT